MRRDAVDFAFADVSHRLMIGGAVVQMAGIDLFFDPADAVQQSGRAGLYPRTRKLCIAAIGLEASCRHMVEERHRKRLVRCHIGNFPRLGSIGDIAVGQQDHRRHKLRRNPYRFYRAIEHIAGRTRRDHGQRCIAIAAINRLIQIGLLGLGGKAG